jgi:hypothetical protein
MRINRWLLFGLLLASIVGIVLVVLALVPRAGISKENFDRIQNGMTRAEVEAIFGGPPSWTPVGNRAEWANNGAYDCATIDFDDNGRVVRTAWQDLDDRPFVEKLLDRLPWRQQTFSVVDIDVEPVILEKHE